MIRFLKALEALENPAEAASSLVYIRFLQRLGIRNPISYSSELQNRGFVSVVRDENNRALWTLTAKGELELANLRWVRSQLSEETIAMAERA